MRAVEVAVAGGPSRGSGYLVSSKLVLTANHVANARHCVVRRADDDTVYSATRIWSGQARRLDAALLEVTDPDWPIKEIRITRLGRTIADRSLVRISAEGFPEFQRQSNGLCDVELLRGTLSSGTRALSRLYQVQVDGEPPEPQHDPTGVVLSPWAGISGAGLCSNDYLIGVVIEDPGNFRHGRLTAVPAYRLVEDNGFRQAYTEAIGYAPQVDAVELASLAAPPLPTLALSPASLLRPYSAAVRFHGRNDEVQRLLADIDRPGFELCLVYAPGGEGKSRLAYELVESLRARGWVGGLSQELRVLENIGDDARSILETGLSQGTVPTVLVVDYGETDRDALPHVVKMCRRRTDTPIRLFVLARSMGEWWKVLKSDAGILNAESIRLESLQPTAAGRREEYALATQELARALTKMPDYGATDWQTLASTIRPPDELADSHFGHVLTIHMAALAALLEAGPYASNEARVEDVLLDHEEKYWRRNANACELTLTDRTLRESVAAATLFGAQNNSEAEAIIRVLPGMEGQPEDTVRGVATWLMELYPRRTTVGWQPLEPDKLGEYLVLAELRKSSVVATKGIEVASEQQKRRALTVLGRASSQSPWLRDWLTSLVGNSLSLSSVAIAVAIQSEYPEPLVKGLTQLLDRELAEEDFAKLADQAPDHSQLLADWALTVQKRAVHAYRRTVSESPSLESRAGLARSLRWLSKRFGEVGQWSEALGASQESVNCWRPLVGTQPVQYGPEFAKALITLSQDLGATGDRRGALASSEEAVRILRGVVEGDVSLLPDLADALDVYAVDLSELTQLEEALEIAKEAVSIHRRTVEVDGSLLSDLARSLNNLGIYMRELGSTEDCCAIAAEVVSIYRQLSEENPDAFLLDLANGLNSHGVDLTEAGRVDEAVAVAEEAISIYRALPEDRRDVFLPDLALALTNLSVDLSGEGRVTEAVMLATEAVSAYRRLAGPRPRTFDPDLANALNNLADALTCDDRINEAFEASRESIEIYRRVLAEEPDTYISLFSIALWTYGDLLARTDQLPLAVEILHESIVFAERYSQSDVLDGAKRVLARIHKGSPVVVEREWRRVASSDLPNWAIDGSLMDEPG